MLLNFLLGLSCSNQGMVDIKILWHKSYHIKSNKMYRAMQEEYIIVEKQTKVILHETSIIMSLRWDLKTIETKLYPTADKYFIKIKRKTIEISLKDTISCIVDKIVD